MPSSANTVRFAGPVRRVALQPETLRGASHAEELESARQAAYQKGFEDASAFLNQQLTEQRGEVIQLMEQTFKNLEDQRQELAQQIGAVLPGIALEIARRVLCGMEPDAARVASVVDEVLSELSPGTRDIEISLPPADLALLGSYDEKYRDRFPGLRFTPDATLTIGDCRLRSSFGLVDATIQTKLATLARALQ